MGTNEKIVTISERKRTSPLKSMRSLIRIGKHRQRDSSGDEERALLEGAGPSGISDVDRPMSQTSNSSEEIPLDRVTSPNDTPLKKKKV